MLLMGVLEIPIELAPGGKLTGQPGNLMSFFGENLLHVKCCDYSRDFGSQKGRALLYVIFIWTQWTHFASCRSYDEPIASGLS